MPCMSAAAAGDHPRSHATRPAFGGTPITRRSARPIAPPIRPTSTTRSRQKPRRSARCPCYFNRDPAGYMGRRSMCRRSWSSVSQACLSNNICNKKYSSRWP
jgi:hypothetical protein